MALTKAQILAQVDILLADFSDIVPSEHRQTMYDIIDTAYDSNIDGVSLSGNELTFTRDGGTGTPIVIDLATATIISTAIQPQVGLVETADLTYTARNYSVLTQSEYDLLTPDDNTLYFIV